MEKKIIIVGAGVAGLVAARHCEEAGFHPTIIDAEERVGGRVKTDQLDGFLLDRGFQVLLTEYQEVQRYLDLPALNLQEFQPGAVIFSAGRSFQFKDPLRDPRQLWSALVSPIGSLGDKLRIWRLAQKLKNTSPEKIFAQNSASTLIFLQKFGFSSRIIEQFFRPFFAGIFLENELRTPASMFRFVFKMFGQGYAAIPAKGMEEICKQLKAALTKTTFRFNTRVSQILEDHLLTSTGERLDFDTIIVATAPEALVPGLQGQKQAYHGTHNLYFSANFSPLKVPLIALVADADNPINSFCVPSDVSAAYAPKGQTLVSVTLKANTTASPTMVAEALKTLVKRPDLELTHLASYHIPQALPIVEALRYEIPSTQYVLTDRIILAGDQLLNPSLDAAMRSGRSAAANVLI